MGNPKIERDTAAADAADEIKLRGVALNGPENEQSVDHIAYEQKRNPDTALHLEGEEDTLYDDGLNVEDDSESIINTDHNKTPR